MTGCRGPECRNDAYRRRLCLAHWELDMAARKQARRERDKKYRREQPFDLEEWCARQRSIVAHMTKRVEQDSADMEALRELARLAKDLDAVLGTVARHMYEKDGANWGEIGRALGVSRQAARQRFGVER